MTQSFFIEPLTCHMFENEAEQIDTCKEWGLLSEKASKSKTYYYKGNGLNISCRIVGFIDKLTAVIQLENKALHCIHPSYLKEMQASGYGQKLTAAAEESAEPADAETELPPVKDAAESITAPDIEQTKLEEPKAQKPAKEKAKKEKPQKIQLPEEKVKMIATISEFTTVPNHFADTDDEVIVYEAVAMTDPEIEIGTAWSSYSATLKKLNLVVGDTITFEAKIVAKKLTKHPVPYKINNPAKIQKQ